MTATNPDAKLDTTEPELIENTVERAISDQHDDNDEIPSAEIEIETPEIDADAVTVAAATVPVILPPAPMPPSSSSSSPAPAAAEASLNDEINTTSSNSNTNIPIATDETIIMPPNSPSSSSSTSKNNGDVTFEPTVDMMVNDFDDEATLEEEEALAAQESDDPTVELSSLQKESDMPIEELLALYNCNPPINLNNRGGRSGATKRGKKRRRLLIASCSSFNSDNLPSKKEKKSSEECINEELIENNQDQDQIEDSTTTTTNNQPNVEKCTTDENNEEKTNDVDDEDIDEDLSDADGDGETEIDGGTGIECDDEDEYDDEDDDDRDNDAKEISQLRKLYPETYGSSEDKRLLRTISRQQSDEEEDVDYSPDEDEKKKTIMVGSEFQAVIPEGFSKYDDVLPYENEDKLLWDPSRMNETQTEEYLTKAHEQAKAASNSNNSNQIGIETIPCGKHLRDDEQALYLLLQCGHNTEEALRRKRINPVPSTEQMSIWSEEECRNFESVLRLYGKDFHTIKHAKVHTRSVGELVQFYYLWKKTERHDVFANKGRLEKKKYNLNPGLTDYMDRFLEELDTSANATGITPPGTNPNGTLLPSGDRSSSPSSSGINGGNSLPTTTLFDNSAAPLSSSSTTITTNNTSTSSTASATITSATDTKIIENNEILPAVTSEVNKFDENTVNSSNLIT